MYEEYCWYEGAYSEDPDNRPMFRHVIVKNTTQELMKFAQYHQNHMTYLSAFRYSDLKAVTAKHWTGPVIGDFYMDIDSRLGVPHALQFTRKLLTITKQIVPWLFTRVYFSGMKGFHVEIPYEAFGAKPSAELPTLWRYIARVLEEDTLNMKIESSKQPVDLGRYSLRQLWRMVGSIHLKTGNRKTPFTVAELMDMSCDQILLASKNSRIANFQRPDGIIDSAQKLYEKAQKFTAGLSWWMTPK